MAETSASGDTTERADAAEPPLTNVVGERVALGPLREAHWPQIARRANDLSTTRFFQVQGPFQPEQPSGLFSPGGMLGGPASVPFAVYRVSDWAFIGVAGLFRVDHEHRSASFFLLVGEPGQRGQGIGTEATRLVLDYAFTAMGLHSVQLVVYAYNPAGIRAYERAGFRRAGVYRQNHHMGGKLWDTVVMDAIATEFESPVLARLLLADTDAVTEPPAPPA